MINDNDLNRFEANTSLILEIRNTNQVHEHKINNSNYHISTKTT